VVEKMGDEFYFDVLEVETYKSLLTFVDRLLLPPHFADSSLYVLGSVDVDGMPSKESKEKF
jgi:hypothetical protein